MASSAGGVATPTGLFEDLLIEGFEFHLGKSCHNALALADRCVMKRFPIGGGDFSVALTTGLEIVRWPFHHALVGQVFRFTAFVALVAGFTSLGKMGVFG